MFHIVVIEDNPGDVELLREAFATAGLQYRMTTLSNGESALQFIETQDRQPAEPIDLILLDINLPRVDGISLLESIKRCDWAAQIPVIVMTSSTSPKDRDRVMAFGGTRLIIKPANLDKFLEIGTTVRQILEQQPSRR